MNRLRLIGFATLLSSVIIVAGIAVGVATDVSTGLFVSGLGFITTIALITSGVKLAQDLDDLENE